MLQGSMGGYLCPPVQALSTLCIYYISVLKLIQASETLKKEKIYA